MIFKDIRAFSIFLNKNLVNIILINEKITALYFLFQSKHISLKYDFDDYLFLNFYS